MEDKLRKSRVLLNKLATMVTPDIVGNQKQFFMLHRLILKVKRFQFHTPKRFSTAVKNIFFLGGRGGRMRLCQIGLRSDLNGHKKGAFLSRNGRLHKSQV